MAEKNRESSHSALLQGSCSENQCVRAGSWQNNFSQFLFLSRWIFRGFCRRFFLLFFVGGGGEKPCPSLVYLEKGKENHRIKARISYPYRTPTIPGKEGKKAQKNKEILAGAKNKEFKKNKERKDSEVPRKSLRSPRQNPPNVLYNKKPRHMSADSPSQSVSGSSLPPQAPSLPKSALKTHALCYQHDCVHLLSGEFISSQGTLKGMELR